MGSLTQMTTSVREVSFIWKGHGMAIMVMTVSILEAMAPAPEQDPDVPQELAPAISVVPTAASQPRLPAATTHPGAQQLELVTLPAESPRVQVVVPALIHCQELEETPAPLVDPTQTLSSLQPQLAGSRKGWSNHLLQLSNQPRLPSSGACWLQPQRMP